MSTTNPQISIAQEDILRQMHSAPNITIRTSKFSKGNNGVAYYFFVNGVQNTKLNGKSVVGLEVRGFIKKIERSANIDEWTITAAGSEYLLS